MIVATGAMLGALFAYVLSAWLMAHYEMRHLPLFHEAIGVLTMLLLGQVAALAPARRASNVPPIVAARPA